MANAAQRYLSNLFNLETNKDRNDKLLTLSVRDASRLDKHLNKSYNWLGQKRRGLSRVYYNPQLDVEFRISYSKLTDNEGKLQACMIHTTRDILSNDVLDVITFSWDREVSC